MTVLHALDCWQIRSQELREAGELDLEQDELGYGKGGADSWQDVRTSGVVGGAGQVKERDPLEALGQEDQDVGVELSGRVVAKAEVDVGKDVRGDGEQEEDGRIGDVKLVEGPA